MGQNSPDKENQKRSGWREWLRLRFGTAPIEEQLRHRVTKTPWYYGDGASLLVLLVTLIVTGMFMALDYSASPESAYESVRQITHVNKLGWLLRALHYWSAGMMVIILIYHVSRHLLLGGYLAPREGIWLIGVLIFFLVFVNAFTGYTLRWDERAVYAIRVALNIFYSFPVIGEELVTFVQGGWSMGANTLSRMYAVHVLFVPFSLLALVGLHVYLVQKYGPTTTAERETPVETAEEQIALRDRLRHSPRHGHEFYPFTAGSSSLFALIVFAIVFALALIVGPQELYPPANFTRTSMPQEEWWFAWYSGLAAYLPPWLAPTFYFSFPIVVFVVLVALPFMDRGCNRGARRRPLAVLTVSVVLLGIMALSGLRMKSPWTAWPRDQLPPLPPGVELTPSAARGREHFKEFGCFNCHAIGGEGSGFAPNLTGLDHRLSKNELLKYIGEPPEGVAMPAFKNRLTQEQLDEVAEFVLVAQTFPKSYVGGK